MFVCGSFCGLGFVGLCGLWVGFLSWILGVMICCFDACVLF